MVVGSQVCGRIGATVAAVNSDDFGISPVSKKPL